MLITGIVSQAQSVGALDPAKWATIEYGVVGAMALAVVGLALSPLWTAEPPAGPTRERDGCPYCGGDVLDKAERRGGLVICGHCRAEFAAR